MSDEISFDRGLDVPPGQVERVIPGVRRILAPNPGPFTFTGTCGYVIGEGTVAILDPGPDDPTHIAALLDAVRNETVAHILVTHTHRDHSTGAAAIKEKTGATVYAEGPHRSARALHLGETNPVEAGADRDFMPEIRLQDGDVVEGPNYALEAIATPGHTVNHLAYALKGTSFLFSGDHVMAWSTSVVAPPDGAMGDYLASLAKLRGRAETLYLPGHGPPVREAPAFVDRLIAHRNARETAIMRRLERGDADISELVRGIYVGLNQRLIGAAALTTFAHLEYLVSRGRITTDGPPSLAGRYRLSKQR